jgi:transcriptional regulator with XRE-family HTH domain
MARTWSVRSAEDLGRALAEIRHTRGLTQEQLAAEGGLSRASLAQLEVGRSTPVLDHFLRLLRRLGATVTITFEGDDGNA